MAGERPFNGSKMLGTIAASLAGAMMLASGYTFLENRWQISQWFTASPPPVATPSPALPPALSPESQSAVESAPITESVYFDTALALARQAARQTQTAQTEQEWQQIINLWLEAIANLQEIPQSDPNWQSAQEKIEEYRTNLNYTIGRAIQVP